MKKLDYMHILSVYSKEYDWNVVSYDSWTAVHNWKLQ